MIAADYRCYIPHEMWLSLVQERLQNKYYRSQDQLWQDLNIIAECSQTYNGADDELTLKAMAFVDKLKKELRQFITNRKDKIYPKKKKEYEKEAVAKDLVGATPAVLGFTNED